MENESQVKQHHKPDEVDAYILSMMKTVISQGMKELRERGFRGTNIEIELMTHIKSELKE